MSTHCKGCKEEFPSRNAVFKHLRDTQGACLSPEDYKGFCDYVLQSQKRDKVIILYGYITDSMRIQNGNDAAETLLRIAEDETGKINRSYGHSGRSSIVAQDENTGAVTEVIAARLPQLMVPMDAWIDQINETLRMDLDGSNAEIRVLGRQKLPNATFNAEMDVSHRKVEYLLPADMLYCEGMGESFPELCDSLPNFTDRVNPGDKFERPRPETLTFLLRLKKTLQLLTTHIVEIDEHDKEAMKEKEMHNMKRQRSLYNQNGSYHSKKKKNSTTKETKQNMLQRKRFHNFTPQMMAHDYLAYRRLDRFYHRSTLRFSRIGSRPFLVLSLTGDLFLNGQVQRLVGLSVAILRGLIDPDIVECLFDEGYPHLIPTPPAPRIGQSASEVWYISWEGKAKAILTPRRSSRYSEGWNNEDTLRRLENWQSCLRESLANEWLSKGEEKGLLITVQNWIEEELKPWTLQARIHLDEYRQWKVVQKNESRADSSSLERLASPDLSLVPSLDSVDPSVPPLFDKVLHYLREADASGLWPMTTPKRQLVMVSTLKGSGKSVHESMTIASIRAKSNTGDRSSAYSFQEGYGGASGSFSIGAFPGETQPKANDLFPELMKAAFELEMTLMPNREPSSTIAINRNAQFRPHLDSGAGAGQSTSLIVGLGCYSGGELVVEGEKKDIRYNAIEFNGWEQRHWTMPFLGERYSLVWFTPKGCEGIRGIDLCIK